MNELLKTIGKEVGVYLAVVGLGLAVGFFAGGAGAAGEVRAVEADLQSAIDRGQELRERLEANRERVRELEGILEERREAIERLEGTIIYLEGAIEERDKIIGRISSGLEGVGGSAEEIGELAGRGKDIVRAILAEAEVGED